MAWTLRCEMQPLGQNHPAAGVAYDTWKSQGNYGIISPMTLQGKEEKKLLTVKK